MGKLKKMINRVIMHFAARNIIKIPDKKYIELEYKYILGKRLNLKNPETFNEKLQWLKLYDRKPEYTKMVDKYEAKKYVSDIIGEKYIIPTLGIYNDFKDIDFEKLPNQFVIKPTHTSGNVFICKNKREINYKELENIVKHWLKRRYFYNHREWPYKNIKPRIIIENYIQDKNEEELKDYKFFCFNGKVKMVLVCSDRFGKFKKTFFDETWKPYNFTEGNHQKDQSIKIPENFEEMKELAEKLANNLTFVRIDFYDINGKIYFGEITFYPSAGYEKFNPSEYDKFFGDMIKLPRN